MGSRVVIIFQDRRQAGLALAQVLGDELAEGLSAGDAIVLGLPRGGVPVAFEIAHGLHLPLDVFVVRKLGVPGQEELAMGAIASGGMVVLQADVIAAFSIRQETIDDVVARERLEIERREAAYRDGRPPARLDGRAIILVDDGLATGATMTAAVRALRPVARRVLVAVPVAAPSTRDELRREADEVICLETPEPFHAVGEFYRNFEQTTDAEVRALLAQARNESHAA
ncbi:MAG: phosphoribosyltransferase [Acidobacteriaceae bacterium]